MDKTVELKIIDYYLSNTFLSLQAVADAFDVSKPTVVRILKRNGYETRKRRSITDCGADLISYYRSKPMSIDDVASKFGFCRPVVMDFLKLSDVPLWTREDLCLRDLDVNYFEYIDTEVKAYYLGFLYADGCIYDDAKTSRLVFQLKSEDGYILERLKAEVNAPRSISTDSRDGSLVLCISSNDFTSHLKKWGMVPHKCNRLSIPNLPMDLMPHFIRGYFDGDGCITTKDLERKRKTIVICGKYEFLMTLTEYLTNVVGLTHKTSTFEGGTYTLRWAAKSDLSLWYDYLYSNANIYLSRKYLAFN